MDGHSSPERALLPSFRRAAAQNCQALEAENVLARVRKKQPRRAMTCRVRGRYISLTGFDVCASSAVNRITAMPSWPRAGRPLIASGRVHVRVPRASLWPIRRVAALFWVGTAQLWACAVAAQVPVPPPEPSQPQDAPPVRQVSIRDPGPDFGFIPNSAQVVQPGRVYVESAFESTQADERTERTNFVPVLLRIGALEGLELRAQMNVFSQQSGDAGTASGHGPLQLGFKYRFNRGERGLFHPSIGVEGELLLPVASAGMDSGKVEPSATLNVDHFLTSSTTLTWNTGVFAPVDDSGEQYAQGFIGAALNQQVANPLQIYVTGEYRAPASDAGRGSVGRVGTGLYWYLSQYIVFVGGYNWGLTNASLDTDLTLGLTFAF